MASSAWPLIHAERDALVSDLDQLQEQQWATPSLCAEWTVRDALAHMTATAKMTPPRFFGKFIASAFRFNAMSAKDVAAERGTTGADALARFRSVLGATTHPPGPLEAMVGEVVVHGEDIRRPLGIRHKYSDDALTTTADFYRRSNLLIGAKRRAEGLTLRADDVDWKAGSGPEVAGPLASIILAITGRRAGLDDLSGEGVATLRGRVPG
jgi:uncharacterized protein (TIGR03083 family)